MISDEKGIEGLPFKILITAIVIGLATPAVLGGLSIFDRSQVYERILGTLLNFAEVAKQYYAAGGGSEALDLDLRGGLWTRVEFVIMGDVLGGSTANVITFKLSGEEKQFLLIEKPRVPISTGDGPLTLSEGLYSLRVEVADSGGYVRVTANA